MTPAHAAPAARPRRGTPALDDEAMSRSDSFDPTAAAKSAPQRSAAARYFALAASLALVWLLVTGGAAASWLVGVPTIAAALVLSRHVAVAAPPWRVDPRGALRFAAFFVRESVRGGIDVARRVSARRLRVVPGLLRYRWRLPPEGPARALFALCVSLLPGSLVANVGEHEALIHTLDTTGPVADELAALEQQVAGLFGLRLPAPEPSDA